MLGNGGEEEHRGKIEHVRSSLGYLCRLICVPLGRFMVQDFTACAQASARCVAGAEAVLVGEARGRAPRAPGQSIAKMPGALRVRVDRRRVMPLRLRTERMAKCRAAKRAKAAEHRAAAEMEKALVWRKLLLYHPCTCFTCFFVYSRGQQIFSHEVSCVCRLLLLLWWVSGLKLK